MPAVDTDLLIVVLALASISGLSIILAALSYAEARRTRLLLSAVLSAGRARELSRIRRSASRRPSRRYIVFQVIGESEVSERSLSLALNQAARRLVGASTLADSGLQLVYYNPVTMRGVIRVRREYRNLVFGVLGIVRNVGDVSVVLSPITTAGTIKKAKKIADTG